MRGECRKQVKVLNFFIQILDYHGHGRYDDYKQVGSVAGGEQLPLQGGYHAYSWTFKMDPRYIILIIYDCSPTPKQTSFSSFHAQNFHGQ